MKKIFWLIEQKNCGSLFHVQSLFEVDFSGFFFHSLRFRALSERWILPISLFLSIFHLLFWVKSNQRKFISFMISLSVEHRHNVDPWNKLVYAVADGQYTYGPLSLYQYHNDEKYSKTYVDRSNRTDHDFSGYFFQNSR